jgi:DNA-binding NtrC family response regulator
MTERPDGTGPTADGVPDGIRAAPIVPRSGAVAGPAGSGEEILVVDDDQPVRAVLARLLRSKGYSVLQAGNAHEAMGQLERQQPAAVITDIVMPGESGIELRRSIARRWPAMPVVLISGYSAEAPAEFAARTPLTWFVQKPFRAEQLLALLAEALAVTAASAHRDE